MEKKKITSMKLGAILLIVFILGLVFFTIYSRWYVQMQKPLVHITFSESATLHWTYETRSTIESADPVYAAQGIEWTIEVYIPLTAFQDYMSGLYTFHTEAISDNTLFPVRLNTLERKILDCGGFIYVYSYESPHRGGDDGLHYIWPGEGVTVRLTTAGWTEFDYVVPLTAVNHDELTGESYLFTIHRRHSAWGWEFYVRRQNVAYNMPSRIGEMANVTPLLGDTTSPIVYWSEWGLYDGALVRLWD